MASARLGGGIIRRKGLSHEQLDRIIKLRQVGISWLKIEQETGIHRRTAKRAYDKWERSKSMDELKEARKDVAAQIFREHMNSIITLAASLVRNLSVSSSPADMEKNTKQFLAWLWEQDLLLRENYISSEVRVNLDRIESPQIFYIGDAQSYHREKELLFESLKTHTRKEIRWEDILDNRWRKARDNCAEIIPKLRTKTSEVVNDFINQEREANLLRDIKEASSEKDPVEWMAKAVLGAIWQDIVQDKLDQEGPRFETVSKSKETSHTVYLKPEHGGRVVVSFSGDNSKKLAEKVTRICDRAYNNLRTQHLTQHLPHEVREMEKATGELREMLNPVRLRPMILRTQCELCPV